MPDAKDIQVGGGGSRNATLDFARFPHRGERGKLRVTLENIRYLLDHSNLSVGFDVIKKKVVALRNGVSISHLEIVSLAAQHGMQSQYLDAFIDQIAMERPLNRVKDWIDSRPWDGIDRLDELFQTITLADDYPAFLGRALFYRWLLSATAAAILEGRRFSSRGVLTLQGPQGIGKTTWISRLVSDQKLAEDVVKRDHFMDGASKDSTKLAVSHWIVEVGELDGAFRKDIARLKGFITNDCDKFRLPYGKSEVEYDRRTVFAATVNDSAFLVDPTGNSRFWTLAVESLDFRHTIDMQQVFAQTSLDVKRGEQWWLTQAEDQALAAYNLKHRAVSAIAERIKDFLNIEASGGSVGTYMTATELLTAMGTTNPSNPQAKEAGATLRELFGPPKRVNGKDKWKLVRLTDGQPLKAMQPMGTAVIDPEHEF
ncbi:hypothetical protein GR702_14230 [Novosphingobium sp. FGD1]|uniref:Virulence-associated protein E-like domain-containing protein n=1 Tax=Novosphingobium silvae TaxID=2692619 RepID=A0A7X4GHT6_9SPHN|nr:VapE domain-containing protein [Novosphingobium silvae]MYL98921.1 hypothetical protein [Novosphingobium silvae]